MNLILYYLSIGSVIYFCLPMIGDYTKDPLMQKLLFFSGMLVIHYCFYMISSFLGNKKNMSEITDKSFLGGFSVLFGLLIYYDMNETDLVKNIIPQVETWYPEQWFSCTVIMLPLLILSFIRVLFSNA